LRTFIISQFAKTVIPDKSAYGGRDLESSEIYNIMILPGSRLASRFARLGRDDDL